MAPTTPYSTYLGDREPIAAMRDTTGRIAALASTWSAVQFERSYAPGKWTARLILIHLAQSELALGTRARMGATTAGYVAQAFDQDRWLEKESSLDARDALDAFVALSRMNSAWFASLSRADRDAAMSHPEYGSITVDWVIHVIAGHQINHLRQLETLA
jgi:hypothetical protein